MEMTFGSWKKKFGILFWGQTLDTVCFKKHSAKWLNILKDFIKGDLLCVAQSASWYKRGPYSCQDGEGHFLPFFFSVDFF